MRIKSRIDTPQPHQAADHQARANQQDQRHRHFDDHKHALDAVVGATRSPATLFKSFLQV